MPNQEFYRGNHKLPILNRESPNIKYIFQISLFGPDPSKAVKQKPLRIKETATFAVDQTAIRLQYPYDLDADDTAGSFTKKDSVRFYGVTISEDDNTFDMTTEAHVVKDSHGRIVSATTKTRTSRGWASQHENISNLYAVFRRRAFHNQTKIEEGASFTRVIHFIMPVAEYNENHGKLKNVKKYQLQNPFIVVHYNVSGEGSVFTHGSAHGNAKSSSATEFRPREHSMKVEIRKQLISDPRAPRIIAQESTENSNLLESISDCNTIRDAKQISNYWYVCVTMLLQLVSCCYTFFVSTRDCLLKQRQSQTMLLGVL